MIGTSARTLERTLTEMLDSRGLTGWMHAVDLNSGREVGLAADESVVSASIFKIPVLVELCRKYSEGALRPQQRVHLRAGTGEGLGGTGYSVITDDLELSLRDLALSMMSVSDNRATDVVLGLVGLDNVNASLQRYGLSRTVLVGDCAYLWRSIREDLEAAGAPALVDLADPSIAAMFRRISATTPCETSRTTPRETTRLLQLIWTDSIMDPAACEEVRRIMGLQVWTQRLGSGFPEPDVRLSGKTGTLAHLRSEAGVVEFPDGGRYAVAVFVSSDSVSPRNPQADAAIGALGRVMVETLRRPANETRST